MRGEYRMMKLLPRLISGSPPHAWGIPLRSSSFLPVSRDHPHMRGEYSSLCPDLIRFKGSPPHAWGILASKSLNQL